MAEKTLEDQLAEAGNLLLNPPPSVEDLLLLLDQVESYLSRVEQSPTKSMQDALCPSMKALVAEKLLRHSDLDVKVSVASCISEITRITAPEAPYDDEQMKEIFQLIVVAFEKLFDTADRSYSKRVSILETVAKVRSCVVMLDLECDTLIVQMFQHFLKSIRDLHPDKVFSSMETIMTLVLEESEDISQELLSPLLTSVKREDQDVLPIARRLGEKVLGNCTAKLKPYLMQAVNSMGISLNDYSKIVTSICQGTSDTNEGNDVNSSGEHLADVSKMLEKTGSDELPQVAEELKPEEVHLGEIDPGVEKSPKLVTSNGSAQTENNDSLVGLDCPKKNPVLSRGTTQLAEAEPDSLDSSKVVNLETKPNQASKKKRGRKANSSTHSAEASGRSQISTDKETVDLPDTRKSGDKEANNSLSEDPSVIEAAVPSVHGKEVLTEVSPQTISHDETEKVPSSSPNQRFPDGNHPRKGRRGRNKKGGINQDIDPDRPSEPKVASFTDQIEDEAPPPVDAISKKEPKGSSEIEAKSHRRSSKKSFSVKANEDGTPPSVDAIAKKESGATSDSDAKPLKRSGKKLDARGKPPSGGGETISEKSATGELSKKKTISSPKSATKSTSKDKSRSEETPKEKTKRKRTPGKEEASETLHSIKDFGENLVGSKIRVWWPKDQMFYEGIVDSFDSVKKKHKVSYADGDVEVLILKKERWEFVGDEIPDGGQATDIPSPDASPEMPQKKKVKTNSILPSKQAKTDASVKRVKGTSTSNSKGEASKSVRKDDSNLHSRSTDGISKTANKTKDDGTGKSKIDTPKTSKLKDDAQKTVTKAKDDALKTSSRSKNDAVKTGAKSKIETPKTGSKSSANGTSGKGKTGTSKVQESEDLVRGKLLESTKAKDSETKSGKKRQRRVVNG